MSEHTLNIVETYALAAAALDSVARNKNAAVPENYAVWYAYATGQPSGLVAQLDAAAAATCTVSDSECRLTYETFLAPRAEHDLQIVFSDMIYGLRKLADNVEHGRRTTSGFNVRISQALDPHQLAGAPVDHIRSLISGLTEAAHEARAQQLALNSLLAVSRQEVDAARDTLAAARLESQTDALTGLANRRYFNAALDEAIAAAEHSPLCIAIFDIDHFKKFNDTFGHITGDQVLRLVASILKASDQEAARYGGEEFALILPDKTIEQAAQVANLVRRRVTAQKLKKKSTGEPLGTITISAGVTQFRIGESSQTFLERADNSLYAAKREGRNRVCAA